MLLSFSVLDGAGAALGVLEGAGSAPNAPGAGAGASSPSPHGPDASEASEEEVQRLVLAARAGDRDAARRLYRLHATRLWRAVRPWCPSDADAEDIVQESFAKAFAALDRYEARPGVRFVSWLSTIALNTARKRARKLGRLRLVEPAKLGAAQDRLATTADDPAGEHLDRARHREALLRALGELPERDQRVVTLRYGAELSAAEVARALDLSEANVRKICERRRATLTDRIRALLEEVAS